MGSPVLTTSIGRLSPGVAGDESLHADGILYGDNPFDTLTGNREKDLIWALGYYQGRGNDIKAARAIELLAAEFPR